MERTIIFMIFLYHIWSVSAKEYYFISEVKNWTEALTYCRRHYTDLAIEENEMDKTMVHSLAGENKWVYIGLTRDVENLSSWRWSNGLELTYTNWAEAEPNNCKNEETKGATNSNGQWVDLSESNILPFICIFRPIVEERKTWEEALEHCREKTADLASIHSESHFHRVQEMMQAVGTDRLWIGLRFLGYRWLWVSGEPLMYQAWAEAADPDLQCPRWNRCAALTSTGQWETLDCQERLFFICQKVKKSEDTEIQPR